MIHDKHNQIYKCQQRKESAECCSLASGVSGGWSWVFIGQLLLCLWIWFNDRWLAKHWGMWLSTLSLMVSEAQVASEPILNVYIFHYLQYNDGWRAVSDWRWWLWMTRFGFKMAAGKHYLDKFYNFTDSLGWWA